MPDKTQVRTVPTWMVVMSILAAVAGVATLFVDGVAQIPLYVIAFGGAAVYFRDRYQAAKEVQR